MTVAVRGLRLVLAGGLVLALGALAGCGADSAGSSSTGSAGNGGGLASGAATISGIPKTTAVAGQPYSFQPKAANTTGQVRFTVDHLPAWAKFDAATGQISGTPSSDEVGQYNGIKINLVAGATTVALPAFSITVLAAGSGASSVTLSWEAPTENSDGTDLQDLKGYKVHYGSSPKTYAKTVEVANPGLTTYVVDNLASGRYYFAVTAYNSAGHESSLSGEVSTMVD